MFAGDLIFFVLVNYILKKPPVLNFFAPILYLWNAIILHETRILSSVQRRWETVCRSWHKTTSIHGNVSCKMLKMRKTTSIVNIFLILLKNNFVRVQVILINCTVCAERYSFLVFGCYFRLLWRSVLCILLALRPTLHQLLPKMPTDLYRRRILHSVDWLQISSPDSIQASLLLQWADIRHVVFLFFHTNLCMKTLGIIRESWICGYLLYVTGFFLARRTFMNKNLWLKSRLETLWESLHPWKSKLWFS